MDAEPLRLNPLNPDDRDFAIRTIIGEAANQGPEGQAAVAHVIKNRLDAGGYGDSVPEIVTAPKQFTPWMTRRGELMSYSPDSPAYQDVGRVVDDVFSGKTPDLTDGATHFANIPASDAVNRAGWIADMIRNGSAVKIGAHTFGSPDSAPGRKAVAGGGFNADEFAAFKAKSAPQDAPEGGGFNADEFSQFKASLKKPEPAQAIPAAPAKPFSPTEFAENEADVQRLEGTSLGSRFDGTPMARDTKAPAGLEPLRAGLQAQADERLVGPPTVKGGAIIGAMRTANTAALGIPLNIATGLETAAGKLGVPGYADRSFADRYQQAQDEEAALARQHPVAAGTGLAAGIGLGAATLPALEAAQGAGLAGRAITNAATGGAYGLVGGAIESHDPRSAAISGGAGVLVGGAATPVFEKVGSALANSSLGRAALARWLDKPGSMVTPQGELTENAAKILTAVDPNFNPAEFTPELQAALQEAYAKKGVSPEVARETLLDKLGITARTRGQVKQDYNEQIFENTAARGAVGPEMQQRYGGKEPGNEGVFPRQEMQAAEAKQALGAKLGGQAPIDSPYGAGEMIADRARAAAEQGTQAEAQALRQGVSALQGVRAGQTLDATDAAATAAQGIRQAAATSRARYQGAYDRARDAEGAFAPGAFDTVGEDVAQALRARGEPVEVDHQLTPAAQRGLNTLAGIRNETLGGVGPARVQAGATRAAAAPPATAPNGTSSGVGAPTTGASAFTPSGREVGVEYRVVDARSLNTSHNPDLTVNPRYPQDLQPRDRTRAGSEQQVASIASNLEPRRLGASTSTADGAPIVGPDGLVESGNGRVLGIRRAYAQNGPQAAAYRRHLEEQGFKTGGMDEPVLVRVRTTPMDSAERIRFAQESNGSAGLQLSAAEQAATDASRMGDAIGAFRGGDVTAPENRDFVRAFVGRVADQNDAGGLATADGKLSMQGEARLRNALLHTAYGDSGLVRALAETGDENARVIGRTLGDVAGDVAKLRSDVAAGRVAPEADIGPALLEAARFVQNARQKNLPLPAAVAQQDAFAQLSPEATAVLQTLYGPELKGRLNRARAVDALRSAVADAGQQTGGANNMFGEAPLTARQILEARAARAGQDAAAGEPERMSAAEFRQFMAEKATEAPAGSASGRMAQEASALPEMMNTSGPFTMNGVEQLRKRLVANYKMVRSDPNRREDARAARAVLQEFENQVERRIEDGLFSGSDEALNAFRRARSLFAEHANTFGPRNPGDDVGNMLRRIIDRDAQPGEVSNFFYGLASLPGNNGRAERAAGRVRDILGADSVEWRAVQQGYISRALGTDASPARMAERIGSILNGPQRVLAGEVLTPEQLAGLGHFERAVQTARAAREAIPQWVRDLGGKGFSPQTVIDEALGRATVGGRATSARFVEGLKGYFGEGSPEFNALRQAYWQKITTKPKDVDDFGPQAIAQRIGHALNGDGRELTDVLYTPVMRAEIREFAAGMKILAPMQVRGKSANPNSDSVTAGGALLHRLSRQSDKIAATLGAWIGGPIGVPAGYALSVPIRRGLDRLANGKNIRRAEEALQPLPDLPPAPLEITAPPQVGTAAGLGADRR